MVSLPTCVLYICTHPSTYMVRGQGACPWRQRSASSHDYGRPDQIKKDSRRAVVLGRAPESSASHDLSPMWRRQRAFRACFARGRSVDDASVHPQARPAAPPSCKTGGEEGVVVRHGHAPLSVRTDVSRECMSSRDNTERRPGQAAAVRWRPWRRRPVSSRCRLQIGLVPSILGDAKAHMFSRHSNQPLPRPRLQPRRAA